MNPLTWLFDTSEFPARWCCGFGWDESPGLGWLHVGSDLAIWSAYFAILCVLGFFLLRRKELPFRPLFLLFGAFILACGTKHLLDALIFWWPAYRLAGAVKLVTAVVSWATVFALMKVVPGVLAMRSPEELEEEIADHKRAEAVSHRAAAGLERRVDQEMAKLAQTSAAFQEMTAHIDQVLWIMDARKFAILYVSPGYEKIWGRSCQSLLEDPHSFAAGVHPLDREVLEREYATMFATGHIDVEFRVLRPDESVRWDWIRGYPVPEEGRVARVVGVIEDVTEKRLMAAERDACLGRLQLHIARMPLAYVLFDADLRVTGGRAVRRGPLLGSGCDRAQGTGGPVPAGSKDGSVRPVSGRGGARLQQPADHHLGVQRDGA